jgi:(p)ppGpp synthase/HD superfamily hydrolase
VLSAYDVRGAVLEVASRWVGMAHVRGLPVYEQQLVALEALQVFAPLAHALGLGALGAQMEDAAFQVRRWAAGVSRQGAKWVDATHMLLGTSTQPA